ncbi:STAS domain-containing protein [Actinomadura hibisca]|uniref:STAS domain-containing protein n=1 Tax=Actinomadura hibisca TaxID=68565 RepID=UPI00082F1FDA|nr:STAS domain-containing protein [Actinomadura hibisca]
MAELWLSTHLAGPLAVVLVGGELDLATAPVLREQLLLALCHFGPLLAVDLSRVTFMDSSGLAVLIEYWKRARAAGGGLSLVGPRGIVARKLEITGLDQRLSVHPDIPAARDAAQDASRDGPPPSGTRALDRAPGHSPGRSPDRPQGRNGRRRP